MCFICEHITDVNCVAFVSTLRNLCSLCEHIRHCVAFVSIIMHSLCSLCEHTMHSVCSFLLCSFFEHISHSLWRSLCEHIQRSVCSIFVSTSRTLCDAAFFFFFFFFVNAPHTQRITYVINLFMHPFRKDLLAAAEMETLTLPPPE